MKHCYYCGDEMKREPNALYCFDCHESSGQRQAVRAVQQAVKRGDLPKASTQTCVDCGSQAKDWDHRDYNKPLEVEPRCRSCNLKRGPAIALRKPVYLWPTFDLVAA